MTAQGPCDAVKEGGGNLIGWSGEMNASGRKWAVLAFLIAATAWSCGKAGPDEDVLKSFPDGSKQEVARYESRGGERHLLAKIGYNQDGKVAFEEKFTDGKIVSYQSWWPNGTRRLVRTYANGIATGEDHFDSDGVRQIEADEIEAILADLARYDGEPATPADTVYMETSAGMIKLRLFTDVAPGHSDNFKRLANAGFYDGTTFHRVIPNFVIQGGNILSRDARRANDAQGGPGFTIAAEFNPRIHKRGTLAMARSSDP
ncbi:MAG: peptidylprolyl isomerase, partial [Candidatus Neomarinimicrobiota bacterium]